MTSHMAMMGQQQSGMMGVQQSGMMGQQNGLMAAQGVMTQPGGAMASPYMAGMSQGMMGQQQNGIMGQQQSGMMAQPQVGGVATLPHQQVYGLQQAQQLQWNLAQVCVCVFVSDFINFKYCKNQNPSKSLSLIFCKITSPEKCLIPSDSKTKMRPELLLNTKNKLPMG